MTWASAKIFFPADRITPEFIEEYVTRYAVDITGPQIVDGMEMTLEPTEGNTALSILFVDNPRLETIRKASWYDGTLSIEDWAVYDPPLASGEPKGIREPVGYAIRAVWPKSFLDDVTSGAGPEFAGVHIMG